MKSKRKRQTAKEKYRKDAQRVNKQGRARAIAELKLPDTVYKLGYDVTYIHSREVYYKQGRETAIRLLNNSLSKTVSQVHNKINSLVPILDGELNNIIQSLNMNSWEEFRDWWANEVQPNSPALATNNEALYYLSLLEKIKKQATSIGAYLYTRRSGKAGKGGNMTQAAVQKLISAGFVDVGFKGIKGEQAGKNSGIARIRAEQRKDIAELAKWLVPILEKMNNKTADHIILQLKKVAGPDLNGIGGIQPDATYATEIGDMFEYISDMFERELDSGIKVTMQNVAAEKHGKNSSEFKADTKHIIEMGDVQISFLSSDKTGMETVFGKGNGKAIGYIDKFTAGISSDSLLLVNNDKIKTIVDWGLVDPKLNDLFHYIVKNADYFGRRDEEGKTIIVSFFAWAKLITELVGIQDSVTNMPVVVRMFNRLYKTSDILLRFTNVHGIDIMHYVNKSYLEPFYKTLELKSTIDKKALRREKGLAMSEMTEKVTYEKLKQSISGTLKSINGEVMRSNYFSTSFRILLDNIENLKELV